MELNKACQHNHDDNENSFHTIIEKTQLSMNEKKVMESKKKIIDLTKQINKAAEINDNLKKFYQQSSPASNTTEESTTTTTTTTVTHDWTQTYQYWNQWEDIEELIVEKNDETKRLNNFIEENNFMGHCNDHTEERKFFELPELEKLQYCERHRMLGNYLYSEGMLPKAAEQYQLALSYYEYCFPELEVEQKQLDILRHACLCNISLCFLKLGYLRESEDRATQAISESERIKDYFDLELIAKSYYRRAQARRHLDEYDTAMNDIDRVLELCPHDASALNEKLTIQKLISQYEKASQKLATVMLGTQSNSSEVENNQSSHELNSLNHSIDESMFDQYPPLNFDMPLEPNLMYIGS